ncbi:glycoside hydrolase [Dioszegia hungarica]|uniref:Glycoside hydrolase n=1 Tax=Dioszegia hungarica TaxID=4972 RepID=A0AA38H7B4_9TREE|nr:glycoside hydrolase [Dioszegia hungarica]KAI9634189.1 glycoside hydrolase [Dioszegia hungarica]
MVQVQVPLAAPHACLVKPYDHLHLALPKFAPYDPASALIYRYRQQTSVNLGSWFVLEDWMSPTMFTCAIEPKQAELDVAMGWNGQSSHLLARHWDEWIKEEDFQWLASVGVNTVRLPIGYWDLGANALAGTDFEPVADVYEGAWPRIVRAINWAAKYRLGVLVDLHGAPGSQNGLSHSGLSGGKQGLFDDDDNMKKTIAMLAELTQRLVSVTNVVGIELLNEPSNVENLEQFYYDALDVLRNISSEAAAFPFYISDAYDMKRFTSLVAGRDDFVVLDHHSYFVFGSEEDQKRHLDEIMGDLQPDGGFNNELQQAAEQTRGNIVIDEWSCALTGGALSGMEDQDAGRAEFCQAQAQLYADWTAGWSFWSYKTEGCDGDENWCFRHALARSLPSSFAPVRASSSAASAICRLIDCPHDQPSLAHIEDVLPVNAVSVMNAHRLIPRRGSDPHDKTCRCAIKDHAEMAVAVGYADGWRVANSFAGFGGSKLGFVNQFLRDHFTGFCGVCPDDTRAQYEEWFKRGARDGIE